MRGDGPGHGPGAPLIPATKSTVYQHPIGFRFVHPFDWRVEEQGGVLVLTPPNLAKNAQGPIEAYMITGERVDAEGITNASDPRVAAFLDEQVRQRLPSAARTGDRKLNMASEKTGALWSEVR